MPLNILKHKTWNIYNRDTIARIEKDEREAKLREEEDRKQREKEESELRYKLLKKRAKKRKYSNEEEELEKEIEEQKEHLDFFSNLQSKHFAKLQNEKKDGIALKYTPKYTTRFDQLVLGIPSNVPKKEKRRLPETLDTFEEKLREKRKKKSSKKKSSEKTIEELRRERKERELKEKLKVQKLLKQKKMLM